jgi:tetratricopeptide (TPR) repeat protein
MLRKEKPLKTKSCLAAMAVLAPLLLAPSIASADNALQSEINLLAEHWASAKYLSKGNEESAKMVAVSDEAERLVQKYPGNVQPLIWLGIITSERASLTWGLDALNLATRARDILSSAEQIDPKALDAGAATSLGVLYYRVPGFPLGWGDTSKARKLLQEAVTNAPNGRDAHYFYADFLYEQGDYQEAKKVLLQGLNLPSHPERPVWDKYFPQVMRSLLDKIRDKL